MRSLIHSRFDFSEMARRSLGSHWKSLSRDEQREFVEVFTGLLEGTYTATIESYSSEKILYKRETREENYAQVDTRLITKRGEEVSINYRLHLFDGEWKVYDVVIENISLINNYRSQFSRVLADSPFDELLRRMRDKQSRVSQMKPAAMKKFVLLRKGTLDNSRPLILASLINSSNERQLFPRPAR